MVSFLSVGFGFECWIRLIQINILTSRPCDGNICGILYFIGDSLMPVTVQESRIEETLNNERTTSYLKAEVDAVLGSEL